ncbi:U-scoloptoxin(11)-Ssd3a-like [Ylistrum balloti]|uniref:U-scoloptoxin(11)-Ssd3a-like n=1 Tax=Ylistrum balloti TaxID=509963 RepID=UPI002905EE20|nr:U-scoloptoxin(11)-Ssd3a-like [Ylistrum balloti]
MQCLFGALVVIYGFCPGLIAGNINQAFDVSKFLNPWKGSDIPECTELDKPCDIAIGLIQNGSLSKITTEEEMCACPGTNKCPRGWETDLRKSRRMELQSSGSEALIQFNYCEDIPELPVCLGTEIALKTLEIGLYPEEILENKCRCPNGRHLLLKKSQLVYRRRYQDYVCSMAECDVSNSQECFHSRRTGFGVYTTTVHCRCGNGFDCVTDRRSANGRQDIYGRCEEM